jgi:hypothetical protein
MRIPALVVLFAVAAVPASGAYAKDSANETTAAEKAAKAKEKVVCKTERYVGSHIPSRICKTKAEWEQAKIDAKRSLDDSPSRRMKEAEPPGARSGG